MLLIASLLSQAVALGAPAARTVPVYEAISGYVGQPPQPGVQFGMRPLVLLGGTALWGSIDGFKQAQASEAVPPDLERHLRSVIRGLASQHPPVVCFDLEWEILTNTPQAQRNLAKLMHIADLFHKDAPGVSFGFYGLMPERDYWRSLAAPNDMRYRAWQQDNQRLSQLAKHVDVIFPSLYTFYDNVHDWQRYALANIAEARRYGKPVYVFLWPVYHDSNKQLAGKDIPGQFWDLQLHTAGSAADAIVVWSWGRGKRQWDDRAPWWQVTRRYLGER